MIKNLIFDFGKVLVDYDFEAFFKKHVPDEERRRNLSPILYNVELQQLLDREVKPFEEIMEEVVDKNKEFEHEIRIFMRLYPEIVTGEVPGMRKLLAQMKEEGYKLYGLTNWCSMVYSTMDRFEIFKLLEGEVISSELHLIKPEAAIYNSLFEKFHLNPQECVFTDDRPENIEGGKALGMDGIVFLNALQYERELRTILDSRNG